MGGIGLWRAVVVVGLSLCAAAPAFADIDMAALYDAAKKEGALNLFGGGPRAPYLERAGRFEKRFPGIKVNFVNGPSNVLSVQIDDARKAGKPVADIAVLQTIQDYVAWKKQGVLASFKPDGWQLIPDRFKDPDGAFLGHQLIMVAHAYRPDLVNVPINTVKDFLNPAFKGKVITTYPHVDDVTLYHFTKIVERYGWSFFDDYAKLEPKWVRGHLGVAQALEKGSAASTIDQITSMNKTTTLFMPADEPVTVFQLTLAIFADAPNPNAAKLYVNWYLSSEEAATVPSEGSWSTRPDIAPPAGFKPLAAYKLNDEYVSFITGDAAKLDALRARFKSYSGEVTGRDVR